MYIGHSEDVQDVFWTSYVRSIYVLFLQGRRRQFSKGRAEPPLDLWMKLWYRGKEFLIEKSFNLTHQENIKKTKEVLRKAGKLSLPLQILWNCVCQNIQLRGHSDSGKSNIELGKVDLNNFRSLVEPLWHRVKAGVGGDRTLRTMFRMPHECLMFHCFILHFLVACVVFQGKLWY